MKKALILAGGSGDRFGSKKPKQFHLINNKMMIEFVVETCLKIIPANRIYVVCNKDWCNFLSKKVKGKCVIIPGGDTRMASTFIGLRAINFLEEDYVYILESNRPLTKQIHLRKLFSSLENSPDKSVAIYVNDIKESIFKKNEDSFTSLSKSDFFVGQTPYLFKGVSLQRILTNFSEKMLDELDILSLIDAKNILALKTDFNNLKVTTSQDFKVISSML